MTTYRTSWRGWLCLCLISVSYTYAGAQSVSFLPQVLSSCGDMSRAGQASLDWTLGQTGVSTLHTDQQMLTQGFQQGEWQIARTQPPYAAHAPKQTIVDFKVRVFPNPTQGKIAVHSQATTHLTGSWQLTNARGQLLQSRTVSLHDYADQLDLSLLPAGTYFLRVATKDHSQMQSYRIVKN